MITQDCYHCFYHHHNYTFLCTPEELEAAKSGHCPSWRGLSGEKRRRVRTKGRHCSTGHVKLWGLLTKWAKKRVQEGYSINDVAEVIGVEPKDLEPYVLRKEGGAET